MGKRKTNKQAPLTKEGAEKKEEKAKKTYALPKSEDKGHVGNVEGIEKVNLPDRLEREIVELILREQENRKSLGVLSKRITSKKLTDVYNCLATAGFSHRQVEAAMTATVAMGGDLHDALDWLCLNTPNDQLPKGFSQTLQEEEERKSKPRFDVSQQRDARVDLDSIAVPAVPIKESPDKKPPSQSEDVKDWILRYAEHSSESSGDDEEEDPNSRYLLLTARLEDAKAEAADAKQKGNKTEQSKASKKIRELTLEREKVETHPNFDPATRVIFPAATPGDDPATQTTNDESKSSPQAAPAISSAKSSLQEPGSLNISTSDAAISESLCGSSKSEIKPQSSSAGSKTKGGGRQTPDDPEENGFNLFGFDALEASASAEASASKVTKAEDVRHFEYTRQQWTGKHPKQFLIDWCRKHLPNAPPPKYHKTQLKHNRFRCKCTVDRPKDPLSVTPDILTENAKESEMLASTLALYHLCRGQSVEMLLPPTYRAVWLEWKDAENAAKQQAKEKENKPRDQFVARLIKKLKMEDDDENSALTRIERTGQATDADKDAEDNDDDDVQDSWEALADDEPPPPSSTPSQPPPQNSLPASAKQRSVPREAVARKLRTLQAGPRHADLLTSRQALPVFQFRDAIVRAVRESSAVVIAGETGSGKSTQVPHFILEDCLTRDSVTSRCNVVVTQPRRISAVSLSSRVSQEMGESPRDSATNLCGHQIRFESRKSPWTCLTYCTTGVVLRQLQSDRNLSGVSHLIIDEVHERSVQSDFLLAVLKDIMARRPDLKVILMSATLDSGKFSAYFSHCPVLNIPGRTFSVQVQHIEDVIEMTGYVVDEDSPYTLKHNQLVEEESATVQVTEDKGQTTQMNLHWTKEDISTLDRTSLSAESYSKRTRNAVTRLDPGRINMDLIVDLLKHIESAEPYSQIDGAVLIFLPGLADIQELHEILTTLPHFNAPDRFRVFALHSVLSSEDQSRVFDPPPPGVRKIVLATNIAETGITIPDVVYVIDSGKAKENRYSETSQMSSLTEVFVSKASARQRQGRAGRVREGFCFRLYTADKFRSLSDFTVPEILRVPLEELCLTIMKCELGSPDQFLSRCLDPPHSPRIQRALTLLREVGACFADTCALTPLGHHLAALPVNVRIGKMLIYAAILGCLEPVAVIAAAMADKSPFVVPLSRRDEASAAKQALAVAASDHLTVYRAFVGWRQAVSQGRGAETQFCRRFFLKRNALLDIQNVKNDLIKLVHSIGFKSTASPTSKSPLTSSDLPDVLDISKVVSKTSDLDQHTVAMVKAVLCAGLYSQVARVTPVNSAEAGARPGERKPCLAETSQGHTQIHPSSVNRFLELFSPAWFVYGEKVKVARVYVRDTSVVSAYPLLLFGGDIKVQHLQKLLVIDNWIKYKAVAKTGVIFKELRTAFDRLLERKLSEPGLSLSDDRLIQLIINLIKSEKPAVRPS